MIQPFHLHHSGLEAIKLACHCGFYEYLPDSSALLVIRGDSRTPLDPSRTLADQGITEDTHIELIGDLRAIIRDIPNVRFRQWSEFDEIRSLGYGACGQVMLCRDRLANKEVAVKSIFNWKPDGDVLKRFDREVTILSEHASPCVMSLLGIIRPDKAHTGPALILPFYPGNSLRQFIRSAAASDLTKCMIVFLGIVTGMAELHTSSVIHRDLKPENVVLDLNGRPAICDFGLSKIMVDPGPRLEQSCCDGTGGYQAPEVHAGDGSFGFPADVWAFGCILFAVLVKRDPYDTRKPFELDRLMNGHKAPIPDSVPSQFSDLINQCWAFAPANRPTFPEILDLLLSDEFRKFRTPDFDHYLGDIQGLIDAVRARAPIEHDDAAPFAQFRRRATSGDGEAMTALGKLAGREDTAQAAEWFARGDARDSLSSTYELGMLCTSDAIRGVPIEDLRRSIGPDFNYASPQAFGYQKLSQLTATARADPRRSLSREDIARAYYQMAILLKTRDGVMPDDQAMFRNFRKADKRGHPRAAVELARCLDLGIGCAIDHVAGLLRLRAKAGESGEAMLHLALRRFHDVITWRGREVVDLLKRAVVHGCPEAYFYLAMLCARGHREVPPSADAAAFVQGGCAEAILGCQFLRAKDAALAGDARAAILEDLSLPARINEQIKYGILFEKFIEIREYAAELFAIAERNGSPDGAFNLARMRLEDPAQRPQAIRTLRELCEADPPHPDAAVLVAKLALKGEIGGVPAERVMELLKRAAAAHNAEASFLLGKIAENGSLGQPKANGTAITEYDKAARRGWAEAAERLVNLYSPRDPKQAQSKALGVALRIAEKMYWLTLPL
jgi:TPR repeat protein